MYANTFHGALSGNATTATDSDKLDGKLATDFSNASDSFNFDANIEPTQTGTSSRTHLWSIQYVVQSINFIWSAIKGLTTGYIPRWNATTKMFENSRMYDNGSQIGVGTTSPEADYHVVKDNGDTLTYYVENKSTVGRVLFQVKASASVGPFLDFRAYSPNYHENLAGVDMAGATIFNLVPKATGHLFNIMTAFPMIFCTNNSEKMRIASNGNMGINNNNPVEKLDVGGNIKLTGKLIEAVYGNITTLVAYANVISLINSNVANTYYFRIAPAGTPSFNLASLTNLVTDFEYSLILRVDANSSVFMITDSMSPKVINTNTNVLIVSVQFRKIGTQIIITKWQAIS